MNAKKHEMTAEEKEARKAARRELLARLDKMNAVEKAELSARWDGRTIEGHVLSVNNRLLLLIQADALGVTLSQVGGFRQWKQHGRKVTKGAKGMMIFFPMERKRPEGSADADGEGGEAADSADGEQRGGVWFKAVYVFDRSQTEEMMAETVRRASSAAIPERVKKSAPDFAAIVAAKIRAAMVA